jgi:uncharacterized protein involved in type VI secretion and phage assembly
MAYDINSIMAEYGDNDFGFTAVDEAEYQAVIAEKDETVEEYKARLAQVEKIIMPFLTNLYKSRAQAYIHWPNRGPILESQMQKILTLTRG